MSLLLLSLLRRTPGVAGPPPGPAHVALYSLLAAASLWQDTAGTDAADTENDTVARLDDQVGSRHLLQASSSARPTLNLKAGAQGNRPALSFDGVNDVLVTASDLESTGGTTYLWTGNLTVRGAFGHPYSGADGDSLYSNEIGGYRGTFRTTVTTFAIGAYHVYALVIDPVSATPRALWVDGVLVWSSASSIGNGTLTGPLVLGALSAALYFGEGKVHQFEVWNSALDETAIVARSNALIKTWDILPTTPTDLSGLVWHLDGTRLASLYQERTGSPPGATLATADLHTVGAMRDQASGALHVAAPSDAARPTLEVVDGKGRVSFDGVNDVLTGSQVTLAGAWTLALSYRLRTTPLVNSGVAIVNVITGSGEKIELVCINYSGFKQLSWSAKMTTSGAASVGVDRGMDLAPHRVVITYNGGTKTTPGSYRCWFDGVEVTVAASAALGSIGGDTTAIGGRWNGSAASACAQLDLDQVLLYDSAKGDSDVAKINDILARKRRRPRTIVVIGNSIDSGWITSTGVVKTSSYPWKVKKLYPDADEPDVINVAIPGQTVANMVSRIGELDDFFATLGDDVQVLLGTPTNDMGTNGSMVNSGSEVTALANTFALADAVRTRLPNAEIIFQTVLPRSDSNLTAGFEGRRVAYNTALAAGYTSHGDKLRDWRPIEGTIEMGDGVHPTDVGYTTMAAPTKTTLDA